MLRATPLEPNERKKIKVGGKEGVQAHKAHAFPFPRDCPNLSPTDLPTRKKHDAVPPQLLNADPSAQIIGMETIADIIIDDVEACALLDSGATADLMTLAYAVNYHSTKLKFLAMKWSIKHFQTYLLDCCFKVHTDNNPLMYFLTSPNMDVIKQRWINDLVKYDFSLEYQKGKNNTVADALRRISEECLSDEEAKKVLKAVPVVPGYNF